MRDYSAYLLRKLRSIIRKYCRVARDEVRSQWSALDNIDGEASINEQDLEISQDTVARALCAYGQKAWIAEYGKGSEMDKSTSENPFLEDYLNDPYFNRDRLAHEFAVVGRPHGYYPDIDGNPHFSHGSLSGVPIETWYGQRLFTPIRPSPRGGSDDGNEPRNSDRCHGHPVFVDERISKGDQDC